MAHFNGKYKLDNSENFEQFMQALGVNSALREIGNTTKPTVTIQTDDGKHFTFVSESTFRNTELEFDIGEEYEDTTPDGRKTKNVVTISGNKMTLIENPLDGQGKEVTYIRELLDSGDIAVTCTVGDVVATRLFKPL